MEKDAYIETEPTPSSTTGTSHPVSSGIFSRARNFTVSGGTFNNITKNYTTAPPAPSDLRMIPLGDIHLLREIRVDSDSGVVDRNVRRLYSAQIVSGRCRVTVAMYQGDGTEEQWRRDIANYMSIRHPNIIQIRGAASANGIHATIFYDELIPFQDFLELHRHTLLTVSIYACSSIDFEAAKHYIQDAFHHRLIQPECTLLMHRSSGRLCVDLIRSGISHWFPRLERYHPKGFRSLEAPAHDVRATNILTLKQYHTICFRRLSRFRWALVRTPSSVELGAVIYSPSHQLEDLVEIASLPNPGTYQIRAGWGTSGQPSKHVNEDGWTRINWDNVDTLIWLNLSYLQPDCWLSQANHIFSSLKISSDFHDYVVLDSICFELAISSTLSDPSKGFLFLCPVEDFQTGPWTFRWPNCPAYWSLDPSGAERLSVEDAANLGFPSIRRFMLIGGRLWDANVYAGLRQFHHAKGFNPESQDISRHSGHILYQLLSERHSPFTLNMDSCNGNNQNRLTASKTSAESHTGAVNALVNNEQYPPGEPPISWTLKLVLNIQLTLVVVHALSWGYERIWGMAWAQG
ncbi:hypothetical protein B0H17DRAFT_1062920 [Mycena rosella]|uniref:Protein kinase domain-containing protein n=1 Tax=Mycena rosella TaxID=1033263 RepID=A0AAD7DJB5_MYCRO|nr:hypothetical protein B0H17DRAFT_1062920 [Mycena rosella]